MGTVVLVVVVVLDVVVLVVDVVLSGEVGVVVPVFVAIGSCLVALDDADVLDLTGTMDVDLDAGEDAAARLLVRVTGRSDDSLEEAVTTGDDPRIGSGTAARPEEGVSPPVKVNGAVGRLDTAVGALGEPGSSPKYVKIDTMPKRPAIPIPFCRCRILNWYLNSLGGLRIARSRSDISMTPCTRSAPKCCTRFSGSPRQAQFHGALERISTPTPV